MGARLKLLELAGVILVLGLFAVTAGKYFYGPVVRASFERAGNVAGAQLRYLAYRVGEPSVYTRPPTRPAQSLPVLLYHGIRSTPYKEDILLSTFEDHLLTLKAAGYRTVSIAEFEAFLGGKITLPDKSFLLTFDDGIKSSYYMADTLLKALDYNAVMFIITKYSLAEGSSYYLSRDEVRAMLDSGRWEIQSHGRDAHVMIVIDGEGTKGHFLANKMWLEAQVRLETDAEYRARIASELAASKRDVQATLGFEPIAFAFPFGDFGQTSHNYPDAQQVILESIAPIYSLANFYQSWPSRGFSHNYPDARSFMIKRINVSPQWRGADLLTVLSQGASKPLPLDDAFATDKGWVTFWEDAGVDRGHLTLQATPDTTGGAVFLDGSFLWDDHRFEVDLEAHQGHSLSLLGHFRDSANFVACTFEDGRIRPH